MKILFDMNCLLCNGFMNFVSKRDKTQQFEFIALQSEYGKKWLENHSFPTVDFETFVVIENQTTYHVFSDATLIILQKMGGIYKFLASLGFLFPKKIRDIIYRFIAKNRYTFFGKKDCPTPLK